MAHVVSQELENIWIETPWGRNLGFTGVCPKLWGESPLQLFITMLMWALRALARLSTWEHGGTIRSVFDDFCFFHIRIIGYECLESVGKETEEV